MTDTANRVLSIDEVMALEEGARVWVEVNETSVNTLTIQDAGGEHRIRGGGKRKGLWRRYNYWSLAPIDHRDYGRLYRVWSLPQPPTQEELEKWPWEVQE